MLGGVESNTNQHNQGRQGRERPLEEKEGEIEGKKEEDREEKKEKTKGSQAVMGKKKGKRMWKGW